MATGRQPAERRLESVERLLRLLDAFLEIEGDAGTNELARASGVNASTVSRLLGTLCAHGYAERVPASGRYRLGGRFLRLAQHVLAQLDLRTLARPHLAALEASTGETATLSVPGQPDAVTVDFVTGRGSVVSVARIGRPSVAHATAAGKVMLAFGPGELPREPLAAFTPRTLTNAAALAEEVERVRRQGHARAVAEREPDLSAIAAPVFDARGELAGILGLQGPSSRLDGAALEAALPLLVDHAAQLSRALGFERPGDALSSR